MRIARILSVSLMPVLIMVQHAAGGTITTYTSEASLNAAAGVPMTSFNFDGIVGPTSFAGYTTYTDPTTGTSFTFGVGHVNVTGRDFPGFPMYADDYLDPATDVPNGQSELITLPTNANAFGLTVGTFSGTALTFTFSNGDSFTANPTASSGSTEFLGFKDTSSFDSVSVGISAASGDSQLIFGADVVATPLPSSAWGGLALLGGLGLMTVLRRRWAAAA